MKNSGRRHSLVGRTTLKIIVSQFILSTYLHYLLPAQHLLFRCLPPDEESSLMSFTEDQGSSLWF